MNKKIIWTYFCKVALFCGSLSLIYNISWNHNRNAEAVFNSDATGYYMYLPAVFIFHGFDNDSVKGIGLYHAYPGTDKIFTKYTCGVGLMQLPFFLMAHWTQLSMCPCEANGYSTFYGKAITFGACIYALAGMMLLIYALRRKFSLAISLITPVLIFTGTNLFFYTICQPGMSHVYSFFLFSLIIYLTPRVLDKVRIFDCIVYGLAFGLIMLIRPTNGVLILYPLLYGCLSFDAIKKRLLYIWTNIYRVLLAGVMACTVFIPQLLYWKYISGSYIIYSYGKEGFIYWSNPKILQVLFDVQNGWLLYSPLMLLALIGLFITVRLRYEESLPSLLIIAIATYLFASWWAYWFGGAFGHRSYIEYYTLLSFGLAAFIAKSSGSKYLTLFAVLFISASIYYNLRLTYLYASPWDGPTWTWLRFADILKQIL